MISIVIPAYNNITLTTTCLNDVIKTTYKPFETIVVDDGSKTPLARAIKKMFPGVVVLKNETNQGFAKTVNKGIRAAKGEFICLLNNDITLPNTNWLTIMANEMEKRGLDFCAPAGGRFDKNFNYLPGEAKKTNDRFDYLVGWCLLAKREIFDKIGLIPEDFGKGFWEDVLWNLRAVKAGFKPGIVEGTEVNHLYHQTFKDEGYDLSKEYREKRELFIKIWRTEKNG